MSKRFYFLFLLLALVVGLLSPVTAQFAGLATQRSDALGGPVVMFWNADVGWFSPDNALEESIARGFTDPELLQIMNEARLAQAEGREGRAKKLYKRIWRKHRNSIFAPEALYQTAQIEIEEEDWRKAFEALNQIVYRHPDYYRYGEVIELQYRITNTMLEQGARYFGIIPYRPEERAIQYFEFVVANAPYSDFAPQALMKVGDIYREREEEFLAIDAYDRLINFYANHPLASEAYLKLAETYSSMVKGPRYDQGATREAISYFEDYLILFPDDKEIAQGEEGLQEMRDTFARSKVLVGDFYYQRRNNVEAARVFYSEAITASPNSPSAELARERLDLIRSGRRFDTRILPKMLNLLPFFSGSEDVVLEEQKDAEYNRPGAATTPAPEDS